MQQEGMEIERRLADHRRATSFITSSTARARSAWLSPTARDEMAAEGHDVLTLPFKDALQRFNREWDEHLKTCKKGGGE